MYLSHSARGAWIETSGSRPLSIDTVVALREGCVDRNFLEHVHKVLLEVALREGCVDRNVEAVQHSEIIARRTPRGVRG